jgi:hypothetical protein
MVSIYLQFASTITAADEHELRMNKKNRYQIFLQSK